MRKTPGIAAIGSRRFSPSMTKIGQIRSSTLSRFSCTSRRDQSALRMRRSRRLPVISSTLRWLAACGLVNLFMGKKSPAAAFSMAGERFKDDGVNGEWWMVNWIPNHSPFTIRHSPSD